MNSFENSTLYLDEITNINIDTQVQVNNQTSDQATLPDLYVSSVWDYYDKELSEHPNQRVCKDLQCGKVFLTKTGVSTLR